MKKRYYARRRRRRRKAKLRFFILIGVLAAALGVGIYFIVVSATGQPGTGAEPSESAQLTAPDPESIPDPTEPEKTPEPTIEPTPTPAPSLGLELVPQFVAATDPAAHDVTTEIMNNGEEVDTYQRAQTISFGSGDEYTDLPGIITFRGNNYRDAASYGFATITQGTLDKKDYDKKTGEVGRWRGSGWTGQPLIVKWSGRLLQNMNGMLKEDFQDRDELVEVIVASLDGNIYFMELSTGKKTRNPVYAGGPTKGTASLDPRGYPILYVGQGLQPDGDASSADDMFFRAFSLIDGELLMKFGARSGDPFAHRGWQAYDSSALIAADADVLIAPGENGVLYTVQLNTNYDADAGTVTMDLDPEKIKYRYTSPHNEQAESGSGRWGIENSAVAWREYLIFTDNAGLLQCVNLNTMELVYANNLTDDSDVSMVLEEDTDNNTFYLYTGCEYDELVRPNGSSGTAYARKLNGLTGEIIWETEYTVKSGNVDGGVLASPILGREGTNMDGLIIFNVTQEVKGDDTTSRLVALDKLTGDEKWTYDMEAEGWSPSSPVPVYTAEGKGYIVQCDRDGDVALIDGATGDEVKVINVGEGHNFEATPAVYENTIVVGSRGGEIFFIEIG